MISEDLFAAAFFEMWRRFDAVANREGKPLDASTKPVYFRYLTVMAFHCFLQERVGTAIVECGIGGEYDSTNVIPSPTVTAITNIGLDHVDMLGKTISAIARQKAGIMKQGSAAFASDQSQEALTVLQSHANERSVKLQIVREHPELLTPDFKLGLEGSFQRMNASLAIEVAAEHLRRVGHGDIQTDKLPAQFVRGLKEARLGGRCETRIEANVQWHLDGAHTIESIQGAIEWFNEYLSEYEHAEKSLPLILIFNQQTRNATKLLREIYENLFVVRNAPRRFSHVVFCSNKTFKESGYSADLISLNANGEAVDSLEVQRDLAEAWKALERQDPAPAAQVSVLASVEEAIQLARRVVGETGKTFGSYTATAHVLITGSVHLVGGALEVLETKRTE